MPLFDYTGQLTTGTAFSGTLEAPDQTAAAAQLADLGVRVTSLRPARRAGFVAPLSLAELTFFNEQLAALTKAGLPLEAGLRQMAADVGSRKLKRLLSDLADDLASGTPLEQAVVRQQGRFPAQYADVIRAGLATGDLGGTLYGLTTHLRLKSLARRTLVELAAYPLAVLVLTMFVASFLFEHLVPSLLATAREMDFEWYPSPFTGRPRTLSQLGPFALFVGISGSWSALKAWILTAAGVVVAVWLLTYLPGGRPLREWLLRRIPGFAQVYWSSVLARFTHTSALAAYSGTPLPELLISSAAASGSPALTTATTRVAQRLRGGASLEQAASGERDVPGLWVCAATVAGPRGDLPAVLAELARAYEMRAQQWVSTVRIVLGPLLFLFVAILIGAVVVGLMELIQRFLGVLMNF